MLEVFCEAKRLLELGEPFAVATVLRTHGSTPQKAGSKLLVRRDGTTVGTLGGGCVEADLWEAARRALAAGGGAERKHYSLNEPIGSPHGMICGGGMDFLVEPVLRPEPLLSFARLVVAAGEGGPAVAAATVVTAASPPVELGRRVFFREGFATEGSLGSAERDAAAAAAARRLLPDGGFEWVALPGGFEVFVEAYAPPPVIVAVGGGHIGRALEGLAKRLGFLVFVLEDRQEVAVSDRFLVADVVLVAAYSEALGRLPLRGSSSVVVATRGHRLDDVALEAALATPAGYFGLVSSRRKWMLIRERLAARGVPAERLNAVRAPVGLDLGARSPDEIALSIVAEILAVNRGRGSGPLSGGSLRDRSSRRGQGA